MDKVSSKIEVSVFIKEHEDKESIKQVFLKLFPFDVAKFFKEKTNISFQEKKIWEFKVELEQSSLINRFLANLSEHLTDEDKEKLIHEFDSRFSDDFHFFMRLDKDSLLSGHYILTDSGECFHIKIGVLAFPKNRANAKTVIEKIFKSKPII